MTGPIYYPNPDDQLTDTDAYMRRMVADIDKVLGNRDIIGYSWNGGLNSGGAADIDLSSRFSSIGGAVVQIEAATNYPPRLAITQANAPAGHVYVQIWKTNPVQRHLKNDDSWPQVPAANEWFTLRLVVWGTPK